MLYNIQKSKRGNFTMKNFVKGFLVATLIFAVTLTGFAASKKQSIQVELNPATIKVKGDVKNIDHFIYNGTTYVPIRAIAEMLDVEVNWDGTNNTISINKWEPRMEWAVAKYRPIDGGYKVDEEYEAFLEEITQELDKFISYLEYIDLGSRQLDYDEIKELEIQRGKIEEKFYSMPFGVDYRTAAFRFLKALDYVETAIYRSYEDTSINYSKERVKQDLENARFYNDITLAIGL